MKYVQICEDRFKNPYLSEDVIRVGEDLKGNFHIMIDYSYVLIKIINDVGTLHALTFVVVTTLNYDYNKNPEAFEVKKYIKELGIEQAVLHFSGIIRRKKKN